MPTISWKRLLLPKISMVFLKPKLSQNTVLRYWFFYNPNSLLKCQTIVKVRWSTFDFFSNIPTICVRCPRCQNSALHSSTDFKHRSSPWKYSMEVPALRWRFLKTTSFIMTVWLFKICVEALSSVEGSLRLPKVSARRWGAPKLPSKSALQKQALARRRWMITQFIPKEIWSIGLHQNDFELSSEKCGKPLGPRSQWMTSQSDGYFYTIYGNFWRLPLAPHLLWINRSTIAVPAVHPPPHHGIAAGAQFKVLDRKGPKTK